MGGSIGYWQLEAGVKLRGAFAQSSLHLDIPAELCFSGDPSEDADISLAHASG